MLQMQTISNDFNKDFLSIEFDRAFEPEKRKPLMKLLNYCDNMINEQIITINAIKESFEEYKNQEIDRKIDIKKDLLVEIATKADIKELNGKIDSLKNELNGKIDSNNKELNGKIDSLKNELNGKIDSNNKELNGKIDSLRQETKADIKELNGKIDSNNKELNGKIDTLEAKFIGEFKSVKLWMKMLVGIALIGITCFSPTAQALLKILKF